MYLCALSSVQELCLFKHVRVSLVQTYAQQCFCLCTFGLTQLPHCFISSQQPLVEKQPKILDTFVQLQPTGITDKSCTCHW